MTPQEALDRQEKINDAFIEHINVLEKKINLLEIKGGKKIINLEGGGLD